MVKLLCAVVFSFSLLMSHTVLADSWGCGEGLKHMLSNMNLTDEQKAKIKPIMDQLKSGMRENWSQVNGLDNQIKQQVNSDKMDVNALNSLVDQKTKLIGNAMKARLIAQNQIMAILTADQRTTIQTKLQNLENKMSAKFKSCHAHD